MMRPQSFLVAHNRADGSNPWDTDESEEEPHDLCEAWGYSSKEIEERLWYLRGQYDVNILARTEEVCQSFCGGRRRMLLMLPVFVAMTLLAVFYHDHPVKGESMLIYIALVFGCGIFLTHSAWSWLKNRKVATWFERDMRAILKVLQGGSEKELARIRGVSRIVPVWRFCRKDQVEGFGQLGQENQPS